MTTEVAAPPARRSFATRRQKLLAGLLIVGALGFLLARGLTSAMDYYLTAKQAVAQKAQLGSKDFRIQGTVQPGVRNIGRDLRFAIAAQHVKVDVVSTGAPPQLFKPGIPVVLDGHWQGNVFSSYQIMVQHGASYVEAHPGQTKAAGKPTGARGQ